MKYCLSKPPRLYGALGSLGIGLAVAMVATAPAIASCQHRFGTAPSPPPGRAETAPAKTQPARPGLYLYCVNMRMRRIVLGSNLFLPKTFGVGRKKTLLTARDSYSRIAKILLTLDLIRLNPVSILLKESTVGHRFNSHYSTGRLLKNLPLILG